MEGRGRIYRENFRMLKTTGEARESSEEGREAKSGRMGRNDATRASRRAAA
jgi:hypothetical protein